MPNIILTGFMGSGKTTVGEVLSRRLDWPLIDMDTEIEREEEMKISEIFSTLGEPAFRDMETEMAEKLSTLNDVVISTGGGVVLRETNISHLRRNGRIICLMARPETVYERIKDNHDRPLLKGNDPMGKIHELLEFRMPYYRNADMIIDTDDLTPDEIVLNIIDGLMSATQKA
jgi:shikimate kinase